MSRQNEWISAFCSEPDCDLVHGWSDLDGADCAYNLFDRVGLEQFQQYEADHNRLITPIVGVPMLFELATAVLLLVAAPDSFPRWAAIVGLVLIGLIWLSTVMLQIPCHTQLLNGFDEATYRRLVNGNWIRTGLWTVRGGLMAYYAVIAIR